MEIYPDFQNVLIATNFLEFVIDWMAEFMSNFGNFNKFSKIGHPKPNPNQASPKIYSDCIWNDSARKFTVINYDLGQQRLPLLSQILAYTTDTPSTSPDTPYTLYFHKLHFLHHLMSLLKNIISTAKSNKLATMHKLVFKKLKSIPCILLQASEVLEGYLDLYMPKAPFSQDTLCWDEVKILLKNCLGIWVEIMWELVQGDLG